MNLRRWGIVLSLCLLLCACSAPQHDEPFQVSPDIPGLVLTVEEDTVSSTELTVCFDNDTEHYDYGAWFRLEKRTIWGAWQAVEPFTSWVQADWDHIIYPGKSETMTYSWAWYYGEISAGEYRIIVDMANKDIIYIGSAEKHAYRNVERRKRKKSANQRASRRLAFMARMMRAASVFAVSSNLENKRSRANRRFALPFRPSIALRSQASR